jgi:hypothetical protein
VSVRALRRMGAVWRTRGPSGFARFIGSRVLGHRRDLLFEADTARARDPGAWPGDERLIFVSRDNVAQALTPTLGAQLARGEGAEYLEGLRGRDLLFAVVDARGDVLHHSFVLFDTRTKALLGEEAQTPLFAHCVTRADARGRGLYQRTLQHGLVELARAGHARAIINCAPDNRASVAGIERAGFRLARVLDTWIVVSRLGVQRSRGADDASRLRVYLG